MTALGWLLVRDLDGDNPVVGDMRVVNRSFARLASSADSIAQACTVELRWWLNEWSFDTSRGVPYIEQLLKRGVSEQTIRVVLGRVLRRVAGVRRMASATIQINHTTRLGTVSDVVVELDSSPDPLAIAGSFSVGGR
jgi:hypothetical protein